MRGSEWLMVGSKAINLANVASVDLEVKTQNNVLRRKLGETHVVVNYAVSQICKDEVGDYMQLLSYERFGGPDADVIRAFFAAMTYP